MNCQLCQTEIEELEANAALSSDSASHLTRCDECSAFYMERQSLSNLVADLKPVAAPSDFDFRLRARLAASGNGNHHPSWRSFVFSVPALGLAASVVLLAVAATTFYNRSQNVPAVAVRSNEAVKPKTEQPTKVETIDSPSQTRSQTTLIDATNKNEGSAVVAKANSANKASRASSGKINSSRKSAPPPYASGQGFSNELMGRGAPVITPYGGNAPAVVGASPLVEVSVRSNRQPLKIHLDDRSGAKRTVTLEPVVFGSQDLTGRETSRVQPAHGIW